MLDVKALLTKILRKLYRPMYFASSTNAITTAGVDNKTTGASITVPADRRNYLIVAQWTYNTRSSSGNTNTQVEIYNATTGDICAFQRILAAGSNYNVLQCVYITASMSIQTTYQVRAGSSIAYTSATGNWIRAIALN